MADFNDRRTNNVIRVQFAQEGGKTCKACRGYGRIAGPTRKEGVANVTSTWRCKACNGLGEV